MTKTTQWADPRAPKTMASAASTVVTVQKTGWGSAYGRQQSNPIHQNAYGTLSLEICATVAPVMWYLCEQVNSRGQRTRP